MLLDENWHSTAVVAVGLRDNGWDVHVLTPASHRPVFDGLGSRITSHLTPEVQAHGYEAAIAAYVARLAPAHVVPLSDAINHRLWGREHDGAPPVFPYPTVEQQRVLRDKHAMSALASAAAVPVPRERRFHDARALDAALDVLGLPAVVKGAVGVAGDSVFIVSTREAAHAAARELGGRLAAVQQFIDGPTFLAGGLFLDGEPLRLFAAEKLEMHPPQTGPAVRVRSCDAAPLLAHTCAVFRALRWTGVASADFMRDADGVYRFLEVNPRPWGSIAAARACGVDLFAPFAALLRGERPAPDLAFRAGQDVALLPQLPLLRIRERGPWAAAALLADPALWRQVGSLPRGVARLYLRHVWWGLCEPRRRPSSRPALLRDAERDVRDEAGTREPVRIGGAPAWLSIEEAVRAQRSAPDGRRRARAARRQAS